MQMTAASQKLLEKAEQRYADLQRSHAAQEAVCRTLQGHNSELMTNCEWLRRQHTENVLEQGSLRTENDWLAGQTAHLRGRTTGSG